MMDTAPPPPLTAELADSLPGHRSLRTRRLVLAPLALEHAAGLQPVFTDPETERWFTKRHPEVVDTADMIRAHTEGDAILVSRSWAVLAAADRRVMGSVALHRMHQRTAHTGWVLGPWARGKGYMTEAMAAVLTHGFLDLDLHRVTAMIDPDNAPSIAVAERLGFVREARSRQSFPIRGEWRDELVFGLLAREWLSRPERIGRTLRQVPAY